MKRILILCSLIVLVHMICGAQVRKNICNVVEHFSFNGIPLNLPLKQFESRMKAKGYSRSFAVSQDKRVVMSGKWSGRDADVNLYYDEHGIVYCAKVEMCFETSEEVGEYRFRLYDGIRKKYPKVSEEERFAWNGKEMQYAYWIPRKKKIGKLGLGEIWVEAEQFEDLHANIRYQVSVSFTDDYNSDFGKEIRRQLRESNKIANDL